MQLSWIAISLALALGLGPGCGAASRSDGDDAGTGPDAGERPDRDAGTEAVCTPSAMAPVDTMTAFRHDFALGPDGAAYSAVSSDQRVYVRVSLDGGMSWTDTPDVPYGTERGRVSVAVASNGTIYVATMGDNAQGNRRGVLFSSPGPTASWTLVDEFDAQSIFDLAVTANGRIYVSGIGDNGGATDSWWIGSSMGGAVTTSDHIPGGEPNNDDNNALSLAADASGNVYAAGVVYDGSNLVWTVRKSINGGSWSPVDEYESSPQETWAIGVGIAVDRNGSLLVVGEAGEEVVDSYYNRWLVRRGGGDGTGWSTIQRLPATPVETGIFVGRAIATAVDGRIFIGGYRGTNNTTGAEFILFGSDDGGATWEEQTRFGFTGAIQTLFTFDRVAVGPDGTLWLSRPDAIRAGCPG